MVIWIVAAASLGFGLVLFCFKRFMIGRSCTSTRRLDGKTAIITGANTGIGFETAVDLAKRNASVILACRSVEKGEKAATEARKRSGNENVRFVQLDLSSLNSIRQFSSKILEEEQSIDILVNNAGVVLSTFTQTEDAFETTMGVNHLGHFLLTNLLLDRIKDAPSARIINVGAMLYKLHKKFDFERINSDDPSRFSGLLNCAYIQSKLANVLFTLGLVKRLEGINVSVSVLHPGVIHTELVRDYNKKTPAILLQIQNFIASVFLKTPQQGAQTTVYCAVDETLEGVTGRYYNDCQERSIHTSATNDEDVERLWEVSTHLVNLDQQQ